MIDGVDLFKICDQYGISESLTWSILKELQNDKNPITTLNDIITRLQLVTIDYVQAETTPQPMQE